MHDRISRFSTLVFVIIFLVASVRFFAKTISETHSIGNEPIGVYDKRYEEVKDLLPQYGVVGYVTDREPGIRKLREYYLAQYSLAPLILVENSDRSIVVGNFFVNDETTRRIEARYQVVKHFQNGVVLFRNSRR